MHQSYLRAERNGAVVQTGFNLVNTAVICAILESISGLEPTSDTTQPRYLKHVIVSSFCPFTLISLLMLLVSFVIYSVFSALIAMLWRLCQDAQLILPVLLPLLLTSTQTTVNKTRYFSLKSKNPFCAMTVVIITTVLLNTNTEEAENVALFLDLMQSVEDGRQAFLSCSGVPQKTTIMPLQRLQLQINH